MFASRGSGVQIPSAPPKPAGQHSDLRSCRLARVRFARFWERRCPILGADLEPSPLCAGQTGEAAVAEADSAAAVPGVFGGSAALGEPLRDGGRRPVAAFRVTLLVLGRAAPTRARVADHLAAVRTHPPELAGLPAEVSRQHRLCRDLPVVKDLVSASSGRQSCMFHASSFNGAWNRPRASGTGG